MTIAVERHGRQPGQFCNPLDIAPTVQRVDRAEMNGEKLSDIAEQSAELPRLGRSHWEH